MKNLIVWLNSIINKHKALKRWRRVVTVLAAIMTFVTTYALILPAITVEKEAADDVAGMYLEQEADTNDMLEENALEFTSVSIAADQENAVTYEYADDDMKAVAVFSTEEEIPEGAELVVNPVDTESEKYAELSNRAALLLDREFIYDVTTCSFYDFALICDGVDVTPKTGLADVQISFLNNTVEHVEDVVFAGRFGRFIDKSNGFATMSADNMDEVGATAEAVDTHDADNDLAGSGNQEDINDELISTNPDESPVIELTDSIITTLSQKGNDLSQADRVVGILAGHVDEEAKAAAAETDAEVPSVDDIQEETSAPEVKTLKAVGKDYTVTLTYDETSEIPEGASLVVSEIAQDTKEYKTYLEKTQKAMGLSEEENLSRFAARFFDIKIMVGDNEFKPESGVSVEITYAEPLAENQETEVSAVHFADKKAKAEVIEANTSEVQDDGAATVEFTAESFSVYGVIYTVDFHYEVNGKMYEYTLPGGGFVSFYKLVEVLGISNSGVQSGIEGENEAENSEIEAGNGENTDESAAYNVVEEAGVEDTGTYSDAISLNNVEVSEATRQFVADVASVEFSSPELVWVGKVENESTVGGLKEANGLEVQYSAELTEEQIAEINSSTVEAGDWALISMLPFDTEEVLTISMKNGDEINIFVTDAADAVMVDDGAGGRVVQTITNPSGTSIDLFDYWITDDLKYSTGMDGWPGHQGDAFSSYQFYHYNYDGIQQYSSVPMAQDPARNNDWYVQSGSLRGNGNNKGINNGHTFKFYPGAAGTVVDYGRKGNHTDWTNNHDQYASINSWTGDADPTTGLVTGELVNGYPQLTTNSNLGTDGSPLAYLFNDTAHSGKQKYGEVDNLLYVDSDGYYTYDSWYYSASYDTTQGDGGNFVLREHASDAAQQAKGFWPFGSRVNWHGMHLNTQFSMPTNGQVLNPNGVYKDMQFEFSGDDDTWLYIDGILVGDGGGIHNRTEIDINFATGNVIVTGTKDSNHQGTYTSTTTLRAIFETAERNGKVPAGYVAANFDAGSNTFKAGTYHTFDMFYLERGGSESNLYIRYNLVSTADFTAHKSYHSKDGSRLERDEFKFELVGLDGRYESVADGTDEQGNTVYKLVEAAWSNDSYSLSQDNRAVMPNHNAAAVSGAGTVASPFYNPNDTEILSNGSSVSAQLFRIGVSEDGNVNFGQAEISEAEKYAKDAGHASVYRYIIRECVPGDAVNADGIKWSEASDEVKLEGGFVLDEVTYDGTIYYMTAQITSWEETNATGQTVTKYGLAKTYYTDDTYTTARNDVDFASFVNGYVQPLTLKVIKKSDSEKMLSGAEFTLTHAMQNEEDKWVPRQYVRNGVTVTAATRTGTTSQGVLNFDNLTEGHYILEETNAPGGYEKGSISKWLLTLTKEDTASKIVLEPSIRPLNADGSLQEGVEPTVLTVENDNTFQYEVLNGKIPRGDIEVTKKWLRADGTSAYTAEEISQLGEAVQSTVITGELWRRYETETSVQHPTVTIYAKLNNQSNYTQRWQGRIRYGTDVQYSMAVNGTGYPTSQSTSTGAVLIAGPDQNITYDNGINKPSGHVYVLQNVTSDTQIYAEFDSSQANSLGIGFYLVSSTVPTTDSETTTGTETEKVGNFTLNHDNSWTVTWSSAALAEHDYDYEYYFQNVSETVLEDFIFVGTPAVVTDTVTGKVTYSFRNISKGEQTDLTVRKVWIDGNDSHTGETISYKIQRSEYNLDGTVETEPYDYIEAGQTSAQVYTLGSSDVYNGVSWQKHHDNLPADNGKAETDPDYRLYRYSVVEIVPEGYTVTYGSLTDTYEETSYDVTLLQNTPSDNHVSVEKKWMNAEKSEELTDEIPEGVYITGTLKRDYSYNEASGVTVNVYFRSWSDGHENPIQLYRSYTDVMQGTEFSLWAVDTDGQEPIHGVTVNDRQLDQNGETKTFRINDSWDKQTKAFVTTVSGNTDIILEWFYNTAYQNGVYYDVSYSQETGSGQTQTGTETVGTFRLDALNNWTWLWTDRTLNETAGRTYNYYIDDIQEHQANGTVVDHYDGFEPPSGGIMTYDAGSHTWSAVIINEREPEEVSVKIKKLVKDTEQVLSGATFTLTQVDVNGNNVSDGIMRGPSLTDKNGELTFEGIIPGRYKLVEIPPDGYIKAEGDYYINVEVGGEDIIEGNMVYISYELANDGTHVYTVENTPGAALPNTGGLGTNLIYFLGIMLTGLAGAGLMMRKRRKML